MAHESTPLRGTLRAAAIASLSIFALATTGCEVVEVIDNLGKDAKTVAKEKAAPAEAAPMQADGSPKAKLQSFYQRSRADKGREDDPNDPIIQCETGGKLLFIRRYDCQMRRGRELS